ncbi:MAG: hypothetical protein ACTSQE_07300 [Candidatus Heimdallarchaeaceae archaeon]
MKQHITIEQLNNLSDKGKGKLREWWIPIEGNIIYVEKNWLGDKKGKSVLFDDVEQGDGLFFLYSNMTYYPSAESINEDNVIIWPLLSIGQMIEFLKDEINFNLDYSSLDDTWGVLTNECEEGNKELCDALWEVVKKALE